jgi:hypothetical protein
MRTNLFAETQDSVGAFELRNKAESILTESVEGLCSAFSRIDELSTEEAGEAAVFGSTTEAAFGAAWSDRAEERSAKAAGARSELAALVRNSGSAGGGETEATLGFGSGWPRHCFSSHSTQ